MPVTPAISEELQLKPLPLLLTGLLRLLGMPGVCGQSRSLDLIRSNDFDRSREGDKDELGEALWGTGVPPAAADEVASAARSCPIAWSNEPDLGSGIEFLRGKSCARSLRPDRPGADAGALHILAPMSLAALALMSLADLLCAAAPVSLAILALMSLADLLCAVAASAWEPDLGSGIEFLRDPADSGSLRPVDRPGADAGTLACQSLALADPIVALAGSNEPDLGSRRLRG